VGAAAGSGRDGVQPAGPEGQAYPKTHPALGVPALPLGAPGGAGGQAPGPQPGPPSRDRGAPTGGTAILPPGVRGGGGVRNVGPGRGNGKVEKLGQETNGKTLQKAWIEEN
jgi:hypothetical protein